MKCFVDTSAFFALLDADDGNHPIAKTTLVKLLEDDAALITSNYVLVESFALIQRRIGFDAVRAFQTAMVPIVHVEFTTPEFHRLGVSALLSASRRNLSLVDCVSFEMMRYLGITSAFTFDSHFAEQGFHPV
ncbi:MAG: PIN domain-containing protein [Pseudomonadota bacterium]|uniref:PIN domain-containing protein n=1 Tax=Candidatus Desulfatibia profunda TaxID=2841695 RepID=A0A8J6NTQ6_9BACT|nr:PIN domain-containing protein [Candidatus Desulfatibia profunda]